jgi:hypothetical protein
VHDLITALEPCVKEKLLSHLAGRPLVEVASLDYLQQVLGALVSALTRALVDAWADVLARLSQRIAGPCPRCGRPRACRTRAHEPLRVKILGHDIELPKLYLACEHCGAPPCSITRLLTGLSSGDASVELKLAAAYCAAEKSYRGAGMDLEVHHGQSVERAKLRRMALEVEKEAMRFAEGTRRAALARLETERRTRGPERLVVEGDGGTTRTGILVPCAEGDAGFGKTTKKRGLPRRKRDTHFREVITIDVREPGEVEATALDVLVPIEAQEGERARRMLATAARKGLGDNTRVLGLGDMGSSLAPSFAEAFCGHRHSFWLADWHHTSEYVRSAATVLEGIDALAWRKALRAAIWKRDRARCNTLLDEARAHRVRALPAHLEKCPVAALATYLKNNWKHMRHAEVAALGLPVVSARAEAQVRDRTKRRFRVPGAWRVENIEPKATLRALIAEGRWQAFRTEQLQSARTLFDTHLRHRLQQAIADGRLDAQHVAALVDVDGSAATDLAA